MPHSRKASNSACLGPGRSRDQLLPARRPWLQCARGLGTAGRAGRGGRHVGSAGGRDRPRRAARPGDHAICMSNGGFGGAHDKLLAALAVR